uniref:Gamma-hydroxybutyrate receptor n=1 Tax=Rattus norvegicus TaxID=10116 RepID=Q6RY99_RAT|nr:gamma-hydroxybutyrate receptor [Rattus norvegicus]
MRAAAAGLGPGRLHAWAARRGLGRFPARVPRAAGGRSPCPASISNSRTLRLAAAGNTFCLASTLSSGCWEPCSWPSASGPGVRRAFFPTSQGGQIQGGLDPVWLFVVIGGIMSVLGFAGCIGALRENTFLLKFFSVFLGLIFFLELAAGILAFVFKDWIRDQLNLFINNNVKAYRDDIDLQNLIDFAQEYWSCCGARGPNDWNLNIRTSTALTSNPSRERCGVPFFCWVRTLRKTSQYPCGYTSAQTELEHKIHLHQSWWPFEKWLKKPDGWPGLGAIASFKMGIAGPNPRSTSRQERPTGKLPGVMATCLAHRAVVGASKDALPHSQWQGLWDVCYDLSPRLCEHGTQEATEAGLGLNWGCTGAGLGLFTTELCVWGVHMCVCVCVCVCVRVCLCLCVRVRGMHVCALVSTPGVSTPLLVRWWPFQSFKGDGARRVGHVPASPSLLWDVSLCGLGACCLRPLHIHHDLEPAWSSPWPQCHSLEMGPRILSVSLSRLPLRTHTWQDGYERLN